MTVIEFARLGGKARARKLSKERRTEIARNAGLASASKRKRSCSEASAKEHASKQDECQPAQNGENKL